MTKGRGGAAVRVSKGFRVVGGQGGVRLFAGWQGIARHPRRDPMPAHHQHHRARPERTAPRRPGQTWLEHAHGQDKRDCCTDR